MWIYCVYNDNKCGVIVYIMTINLDSQVNDREIAINGYFFLRLHLFLQYLSFSSPAPLPPLSLSLSLSLSVCLVLRLYTNRQVRSLTPTVLLHEVQTRGTCLVLVSVVHIWPDCTLQVIYSTPTWPQSVCLDSSTCSAAMQTSCTNKHIFMWWYHLLSTLVFCRYLEIKLCLLIWFKRSRYIWSIHSLCVFITISIQNISYLYHWLTSHVVFMLGWN